MTDPRIPVVLDIETEPDLAWLEATEAEFVATLEPPANYKSQEAIEKWFRGERDKRAERAALSPVDGRITAIAVATAIYFAKMPASSAIRSKLGPLPMSRITRAHLEQLVEELDHRVRAGELSWKTATNAWGLLTKAFSDACRSKVRALRVREDNPAEGVAGPDRGIQKSKAYLFPKEFLALISCQKVPAPWRRMYAIAVYLYARAAELLDERRGEIGVAAIPLSAFYGSGFDQKVIRFCFAKKDETLQLALGRLARL